MDRALLVAVEFTSSRRPVPRAALLARQAALVARDADTAGDAARDEDAPGVAAPQDHADTSGRLLPSERPVAVEASLDEFRELVTSAGAQIVAEVIQRRPKADPATLIGRGKVEEVAALAAGSEATTILFDHDLSPTQLRNLEDALPCPVVDRTQLILDIFARHARTREGQLQVELAQLEYMLPRLTGRGKAMSQLGGGIGTRGPGETQLETDRRRIQRRLVLLRRELEGVRKVRGLQRHRRESVPVPTVALVGYTNAGKSTLFNLLTDAGVLASPRMFATLDPKLKAILLPSRRKILLSDTVGFIRNLPHTLVTSFRATLEEVEKAEVLLHVRDAANPRSEEHKAEVEKVLGELGVLAKPRIEVWNKLDLLPPDDAALILHEGGQQGGPDSRRLGVSALRGTGVDRLLEALDRALVLDPVIEQVLKVPQAEGDVLAALEAGGLILRREFEGEAVSMLVAAPASLLGRYRRFRAAPSAS